MTLDFNKAIDEMNERIFGNLPRPNVPEPYNGEPTTIVGAVVSDDRGSVSFINSFNPKNEGVKRYYVVRNHKSGFIRAWHGHKKEAKFVTVTEGAAIVGAVKIDDWEKPSKNAKIFKQVLAASNPSILYIPPGYANGFMTLTEGAILHFFSTSTLEESKGDDIRFDARYWDIWNVEER